MKKIFSFIWYLVCSILNPVYVYYVWIKRYHKHNFKRIEDASACGFSYPQHKCQDPKCNKILGLNLWQMRDLPLSMLYVKLS